MRPNMAAVDIDSTGNEAGAAAIAALACAASASGPAQAPHASTRANVPPSNVTGLRRMRCIPREWLEALAHGQRLDKPGLESYQWCPSRGSRAAGAAEWC
jgi:hypothetical protein